MTHKSILFKSYVIYLYVHTKIDAETVAVFSQEFTLNLYVHTKIDAETVADRYGNTYTPLYVHTKIDAETVPTAQAPLVRFLNVHTKMDAETVVLPFWGKGKLLNVYTRIRAETVSGLLCDGAEALYVKDKNSQKSRCKYLYEHTKAHRDTFICVIYNIHPQIRQIYEQEIYT